MAYSFSKTATFWSNREIQQLRRYRQRVREIEEKENMGKILSKDSNQMSFYDITPKEELPKTLQKMNFQTLNSKQVNVGSFVKVHQKEKIHDMEKCARNILRSQGQIMLLSEIYDHLGDPLESSKKKKKREQEQMLLKSISTQLDEWQKRVSVKKKQNRFSKVKRQSLSEERRNSSHKKQFIIKKFKIGSDYKAEIEKSLDVIAYTHTSEPSLMSKYGLIENSSKLLKKELEQMKEIVKKEISEKMVKLTQSRKEHHRLYEEKLKLQMEEQELDEEINKDQVSVLQNLGYSVHSETQNKMKAVVEEKKNQIEKNEAKIQKIKKTIQFLEEETIKNEEELKNILSAQKKYYQLSLKKGIDCRDSGLVWVIRKLGLQETDIPHVSFPEYLDKKSKVYLVKKSKNEQVLDQLLKEKRQFVSEIGKQSAKKVGQGRKSSIKLDKLSAAKIEDCIRESSQIQLIDEQIPKKYQRSAKKITALREQYMKNEGLLKLSEKRGSLKFGSNINGLTGKQIYELTGQKIKQVDFSKLRKNQMQRGRDKIFEYQSILKDIEALHMQMQEQEIQHENYLLVFYKDQKDQFFSIAAACFGVKRAYALIIKNFSWKNGH